MATNTLAKQFKLNLVQGLNLKIGQVFHLVEDDWNFPTVKNKKQAALTGLAIDRHIKRLISGIDGVEIPDDRYSKYDFKYNGTYFDIKSHTTNSVSISEYEIGFGYDRIQDGSQVVYAVFAQNGDTMFTFEGFITLCDLEYSDKILESQYSGVYFTLRDSAVRKHLFE